MHVLRVAAALALAAGCATAASAQGGNLIRNGDFEASLGFRVLSASGRFGPLVRGARGKTDPGCGGAFRLRIANCHAGDVLYTRWRNA
jgi:hypothetical protein